MKNIFYTGLIIANISSVSIAQDLSPLEIAQLEENRNVGNTSIAQSQMTLIDKKGFERKRDVVIKTRQFEDNKKTLVFFESPADIRNTAFLSYDWKQNGRLDDSWLYLPALKKTKRLSSADQSGAFVGTDFSIYDVNGIETDDWEYSLKNASEMVDGHDTWVVNAVPNKKRVKDVKEKTGYAKYRAWIRKDIGYMVRAKFWVIEGKNIKYFNATDIKKIDGIWTAATQQMITTHRGKKLHSTVISQTNIVYNSSIDEMDFREQKLAKGL